MTSGIVGWVIDPLLLVFPCYRQVTPLGSSVRERPGCVAQDGILCRFAQDAILRHAGVLSTGDPGGVRSGRWDGAVCQ